MNSKVTKTAPSEPTESTASPTKQKRPLVESLRDVFTLVSAGAGVFVVLFYLAGRIFAGGYFEAMNIPLYLLTFSLWEYGEVGGIGLFLGMLGIVAVGPLVTGVLFLIDSWLSARSGKKSEHKEKIKPTSPNAPESSKEARLSFQIFIFTLVCFVVFLILVYPLTLVASLGKSAGRNAVLENAAKIELISTVPLALNDNNLAPTKASGQDYYIYKGFHLLTLNDGKYYLFKEIDPVTCKPLKVYIINAEKALQINLSVAESFADQCQITNPPTVTATPTKIQSTPTP